MQKRRERLEGQIRRLKAIRDWDTWLAISTRIDKEKSGSPVEVEQEPPRRRYRRAEIDGREILIGRNGRENDEVTFQLAQPDDFWLHVSDHSGSHVVVRNPNRDKD